MKISEIQSGMVLQHISDVNERPQKLIVIKIAENSHEDQDWNSVFCEWISRDGIIQEKWLNPLRLKKW